MHFPSPQPLINDAHCHFFSTPFFAALGRGLKDADPPVPHETAIERLGWERPGSAAQLADRWSAELDRAGVSRAALIASVTGDAESVAVAIARHRRFVGYFMLDPMQPNAVEQAAQALDQGLSAICLFPAMHRYPLRDSRVKTIFALAAARPGTVLFTHCGVLSVGARTRLGIRSAFDVRYGNPLQLHHIALEYPTVPIIIPHFGAGFLREALMVADMCPNILFDTSSSNGWLRYHPGLSLGAVFRQAIDVLGPDRLLFGTDSSFFPRGWVKSVYDQQSAALDEIGASIEVRSKIFAENFDRLFSRR
jgi:uncharacterized protein